MIDCADGSNSRANSDGDRPSSRTSLTSSALYSDGHGGRVRPPIVDSPLDPLKDPRIRVSTKPGQLQFRVREGAVWTANALRLYCDLRRDPQRGRELSEHLRSAVIGF